MISSTESRSRPAKKRRKQRTDIHVVSEATGSLGRHIASNLLSQFPKLDYTIQHYSFRNQIADLREVKQAVQACEAPLVLSVLTKSNLKRSMKNWCERHEIRYFDLLGDVVDFVSDVTGHRPVRDATRAHPCDAEYYQRIDAWEYTLQHDDSRRLETIDQADIVLLGVSRAGKTPLAAYLGSLGFRVANVAIAPEAEIPKAIKACRAKAIGLTLNPSRLAEIRRRRFELNRFKQAIEKSNLNDPGYDSRRTAIRDMMFAEDQFRRLRIATLDMTDLTVEESAAHVLQILNLA